MARKLTDEQYDEIMLAYRTSESIASISERFNVCPQTVIWIAKKTGTQLKTQRSWKQRIIQASISHPMLTTAEIAEMTGASYRQASRVRKQCGFSSLRKNKAELVADILDAHPDLTNRRIAHLTGASVRYIQHIRLERNHVAPFSAPTLNQGGLQSLST